MAEGRGPILLPYQLRWIEDRSKRKIWLASRQVGKSFALSMEAVALALEDRSDNLLLSSSERQSRELMRKVYSHLRYLRVRSAELIRAESESRTEVVLPNGSRIVSLPSSPDTVRGFSGNVFLDEFAFHRDTAEIWRAMYPTVTRGFLVRVSSTPNGKLNRFYELWAEAEERGFSRHETSIHDAVAQGLQADPEEIRSGIGDPESWAQEFECRFVDEATAYLPYELIAACESEEATRRPARVLDEKAELYLGLDIGRKRDLSVFWLWERVGDVLWSRLVEEMKGASYAEQREFLYSLMGGEGSGGPRVRRACLDASGLGGQLAEEAAAKFGPRLEQVIFTQRVKEDLAVTTRRLFEERRLRIPRDKDIREDFHSIERVVTSAGNLRFDATRGGRGGGGGHADRFWAAALGLHAAGKQGGEEKISYERLGSRRSAEGSGGGRSLW